MSPEQLVKSKQRIADHGEVFTPAWLVEDMLDLVKDETERIESRFLEPACGSGNFLVPILKRKLAAVQSRYGKSEFERQHYGLLGLMCIYGIELLEDNVAECRLNLLEVFCEFIKTNKVLDVQPWFQAASYVLEANIIHGDALAMTTNTGEPIIFAEWAYLGRGLYQRRDFTFEALSQRSSYEGSLFETLSEDELFRPTATYPPMTVTEVCQ